MTEIYCDNCGKKCISRKYGRLEFSDDGRLIGFSAQTIEDCKQREERPIIKLSDYLNNTTPRA